MGTREEFEKLDEIAETIKNGIYYDEKSNSYWSAVGASYVSLARINGAWYAFQEQQKRIDAIKAEINRAVLSLRNEFNLWADDNEQFHAIEAQIEQLEELLK